MAMGLRRLRGFLLRLTLQRRRAIPVGLIFILAAVMLVQSDVTAAAWWSDGLALVLGATGLALIFASLGGRKPDWIE